MLDKQLVTFRLRKREDFCIYKLKTLQPYLKLNSLFLTPKTFASFVQIFLRMSYAKSSTKILQRQSQRGTGRKVIDCGLAVLRRKKETEWM